MVLSLKPKKKKWRALQNAECCLQDPGVSEWLAARAKWGMNLNYNGLAAFMMLPKPKPSKRMESRTSLPTRARSRMVPGILELTSEMICATVPVIWVIIAPKFPWVWEALIIDCKLERIFLRHRIMAKSRGHGELGGVWYAPDGAGADSQFFTFASASCAALSILWRDCWACDELPEEAFILVASLSTMWRNWLKAAEIRAETFACRLPWWRLLTGSTARATTRVVEGETTGIMRACSFR